MKTLFITPGPIKWASSRFRAHWVAKYMDKAKVVEYQGKEGYEVSDNIIFVKVIDTNIAKDALNYGSRIWWDVCDPVWWFSPKEVEAFLPYTTGVVASNPGLAEDFESWSGRKAYTIPDRLEMSHYKHVREHGDLQPVRFIWFGAGQNRIAIFGALANLDRLAANGYNISLTICDDQPMNQWGAGQGYPVYYVEWTLDNESYTLASHDIALLPPYPGPWGAVKSNNKELTAWASGLPVTTGYHYDELVKLVEDWQFRSEQGSTMRNMVMDAWQVEKSAKEWEALLWG